jgi:hypothetical protein
MLGQPKPKGPEGLKSRLFSIDLLPGPRIHCLSQPQDTPEILYGKDFDEKFSQGERNQGVSA